MDLNKIKFDVVRVRLLSYKCFERSHRVSSDAIKLFLDEQTNANSFFKKKSHDVTKIKFLDLY